MTDLKKPKGELSLKTIAMPASTNANGDIFGGWLVSQMDIAACILAKQIALGRVATVAIDSMSFHYPVQVGDVVSCYCELIKIGNSSIKIKVETWIQNDSTNKFRAVTEGMFIIVAIDNNGKPRKIKR
ncbi:MAG: acyl-CoA thioesterase [Legionellales bacterium]|nr:acyl-CoA thioesterase [Legionellales bacterium]